jgi:elongation factor Ts
MINTDLIKQLREQTGISIMECKKALEETSGDLAEAKKILQKKGIEKAEKKADRETKQGIISSYIHATGRVGAMVELLCETDFVARTDDFLELSHEICMQIAAMDPKDISDLEKQPYIRDNGLTIKDLIKNKILKLGENIKIGRLQRFSINE